MRQTFTKADWLAAHQCIGMAWHQVRSKPPCPVDAARFRMRQGEEVGALARTLFTNGILVSPATADDAVSVTRRLIAGGARTLFEAAALAGPFTARADVLTRADHGWHVIEVKSGFSDTENVVELTDDLAYTAMVFTRAGVPVTKASLILLSRGYRFGDSADQLFTLVERTEDVLARLKDLDGIFDAFTKALSADMPPPARLVPACRDCPVFEDKCLGAGVPHTVLELPQLHPKKLMQLSAQHIVDLADLPADFPLNERQQRARSAAMAGKPVIESGLRAALAAIAWPCYYLDFETVSTVLPLYPAHGCHDQVLTQFSIHRRERLDATPTHTDYLADPRRDCQRELAEALIASLGDIGAIVVYSGFERTRIMTLQTAFADLAPALERLLGRLVDLCAIVADHVYHPDFRGSFSIKKVLPALVPELSYEGLAIADGDAAVTWFARMARGDVPPEDVEHIRQSLLEYCERDTLAMLRLHERLLALAS